MIGEKLVNRYEILEKVGDGGMALVYRAKDTLLNRIVAVKVLRDQFSSDMEFVERFRREAQAAASLSHQRGEHLRRSQTDTAHFIVMEYVQGQNLSAVIREKGALSDHFVVNVALQIAKALARASARHHPPGHQAAQYSHHPRRPGESDRFWHRAGRVGSQPDPDGSGTGFGPYFSPEQARGVNVTVRATSTLWEL